MVGLYRKYGGTIRSIKKVYRKSGGVIRLIKDEYVKVGGVIQHVFTYQFTANFVIASNTANFNWRSALVAAGWDGVAPVISTITVNSGVTLYATSTGTAALVGGFTGALPAGSALSVVNNGTIQGKAGAAGNGGSVAVATTSTVDTYNCGNGSAGQPGGDAINITVPVTITNNGTVAGGGGGGGGGGAGGGWYNSRVFQSNEPGVPDVYTYAGSANGGGGGGGGAGGTLASGTGGTAGGPNGHAGSSGGASGGAGGDPVVFSGTEGSISSGAGGDGGNRGANGGNGGNGDVGPDTQVGSNGKYIRYVGSGLGASGGLAGAYINGASNVTWATNGTRLGRSV